jgi:hypothetical protein
MTAGPHVGPAVLFWWIDLLVIRRVILRFALFFTSSVVSCLLTASKSNFKLAKAVTDAPACDERSMCLKVVLMAAMVVVVVMLL